MLYLNRFNFILLCYNIMAQNIMTQNNITQNDLEIGQNYIVTVASMEDNFKGKLIHKFNETELCLFTFCFVCSGI